jgi:hypothetical protein
VSAAGMKDVLLAFPCVASRVRGRLHKTPSFGAEEHSVAWLAKGDSSWRTNIFWLGSDRRETSTATTSRLFLPHAPARVGPYAMIV